MSGTDTAVAAAQVAVVAAQQATTAGTVADHELRLRSVEAAVIALQGLPAVLADLETRQRSDEKWRYAVPLTAIAAVIAALGAATAAAFTAFGPAGQAAGLTP